MICQVASTKIERLSATTVCDQHNNRLLYWKTAIPDDPDPVITGEAFYRYGPDGNVSIHARRTAGIADDTVYYFYYDSSDHLWLVVQVEGDYDEETGETDDLEAASAMEYRYDGARQRYLVMPRDPETLEPIDPANDGRWRDYAGDGIYLDYKADDIQGGTVNEVRQYLAGVGFNDRNEDDMPVHFAADHLGSNRWMLGSDSTPPLLSRNVYTAFGEERRTDGTLGTRYGFAGAHGYESGGKGEDPLYNLGWLHLGHRYYDPGSGRFMQRDPIGIAGGLNVYVYAANNPNFGMDPQGLSSPDIGFLGEMLEWIGKKLPPRTRDALGRFSKSPLARRIFCGAGGFLGFVSRVGGAWATGDYIGDMLVTYTGIDEFIADMIHGVRHGFDPDWTADPYYDWARGKFRPDWKKRRFVGGGGGRCLY